MSLYNKNRIVLISPNDGTDVRIGKVCRSLSKMGFDIHFVGWDRRPGIEKSFELGSTCAHVMTGATIHGRFTVSGGIRFARHVVKHLWQLRPNTVCCVNEEYALLVLPLRYLFYRYLVCDVFDALYDRHSNRNWLVCHVLKFLSVVSRTGTDCLIATDVARFEKFGRHKNKSIVIGNYPEDPGEELAFMVPEGPVKIYAAGSMSVRRGLQQLIDVVDEMTNVEIISAGWLYDDYAKNVLSKHPMVTFHGIVSAQDSLRLAATCDAVFGFYEPSSVNNRLASPNKVYDAMSIGRPLIINEEAGVSQWVMENGVGLRTPYYNTDGLKQIIQNLKKRRNFLPGFAKHSRQLLSQGYSWEKMEQKLYVLYRSFL